jgi:aminopeptidase S
MGSPNGLLALGGVGSGGGTVSNTFSVAASPSSGSLVAGNSTSVTVNTTTTAGSAQNVALSASGAPAGVNVSFSPSSVTSGGSSTMTVTASASVTPGSYTIAVNGTGSSANASGTYGLTVSAPTGGGSTCTVTQVLKNTGFESGTSSWTTTAGVVGKYTGSQAPHSGVYDGWLDGYGTTHTDSAAQTVSIPSGCTNVSVSFWMRVSTQETTSSAVDTLKVTLGSTALGTFSNLNKSSGWVQYTLNTTVPAGTTSAALKFTGAENSSRATSFLIDDIALNMS